MRYLEKFILYEQKCDLDYQIEELRDFCETYLAYLLDDGFYLNFDSEDKFSNSINIWLRKRKSGRKYFFSWNEIKNYFIPFLFILSKNYEMDLDNDILYGKCIIVFNKDSSDFDFNIDEIEHTTSLDKSVIDSIVVMIKIK